MARFVSPHRNYSHGVRAPEESKMGLNGVMTAEVTYLSADFTPDLRTPADDALAKSTFAFRGLAIHENGQTIDPAYRISVFDSEVAKLQNGWSDEDEALVVKTLREEGPIGQMYVEAIPVATLKPWPGYDGINDVERIVELAVEIGADLTQVAAYETENQARPEVLEALKAASQVDETIIVSA